jgi:hypothetical protein
MSDIVPIPAAVFESPAFLDLTYGDRVLLLQIYHARGDCDSFHIDADLMRECGFPTSEEYYRRIDRLTDGGFVTCVGRRRVHTIASGPNVRVFRLVHQARVSE